MPSLINELAVEDLKNMLEGATSLMLVDPAGLKADESLAFRKNLFDAGAQIRVAKARLVKLVLPEDLQGMLDSSGSLGVVAGEDIAAAARVVRDLAKEEKVVVCGGLAEGTALDGSGALRLADLPSKQEARAMVARAIRAPAVKLAKILKAPYRKLGRAVQARKEKLED